ncbi:hypothetical protein ACFY41_08495 [Streptomyces syringium]|uniref:hypothetical protein n=1 Tax=Streptomyces syringium TaxID=76729 RepID=UPI0036C166D6
MASSLIRRAALGLGALAMAGSALTLTAGSASAASGGGCNGETWKQACVSADGGSVRFDVHARLATTDPNCRLELVRIDATDGWVDRILSGPCNQWDRTAWLPNPSRGHAYKSELRVYWNGGEHPYDYIQSPLLNW